MKKPLTQSMPRKTKSEKSVIYRTSYHFWRNWIKYILSPVKDARFIRDEVGYSGAIEVPTFQIERVKKILAAYKKRNPNEVDMWFDL